MLKLTKEGLKRLQTFLILQDDEGAMILPELDGYLAGVLVCPERISPNEWMPGVWGEAGPGFVDEAEAHDVLGLILALYNDILSRLNTPSAYGPRIARDFDGTYLWEFWAEGFGKAIALRPRAWETFMHRAEDDPAGNAFHTLISLATIAMEAGTPEVPSDDFDEGLMQLAPEIIAASILELHLDRKPQNPFQNQTGRVGKHDPCPCGSGLAYMTCCLGAGHC